jgi:hypothetical protein
MLVCARQEAKKASPPESSRRGVAARYEIGRLRRVCRLVEWGSGGRGLALPTAGSDPTAPTIAITTLAAPSALRSSWMGGAPPQWLATSKPSSRPASRRGWTPACRVGREEGPRCPPVVYAIASLLEVRKPYTSNAKGPGAITAAQDRTTNAGQVEGP